MEENRGGGFWQSHFGWAIELGYRLMTNIFGDNFPVAAGPPLEFPARAPAPVPARVVLGRRPHTRRCHENHDRPSDPEPPSDHNAARADRVLCTAMAIALRRYIQFGGLVQFVSEVSGVPREAVVHLDVEGRIGVINNRIRAEHRVLFKELQRCLDNIRGAFVNENSNVMEDFDRVQTDRLQLLNAVDFGGNIVPLVRENLKRIQIDGLDILAEYYASSNDAEKREYDEMISEMATFTFHELFLYGQQGYRKCYYEIELTNQEE